MRLKKILTSGVFIFTLFFFFYSFAQEEEENGDKKDYWEGIEFGPDDFAEIRRFIKIYYIDPEYDKSLAWGEAANFALHEMKPERELLPESFYEKRKLMLEEKKRLGGNFYKLEKDDKYVIHYIQNGKEDLYEKKLSRNELIEKKQKEKKRAAELQKAWKEVNFTKKDFDKIVDHIFKTNRENPGFKRSKIYISAAKGYLSSLDPHSNIIPRKAWEETTKNATDSSFEGIGAVLTQKGKWTIVETPMEGQPAQLAGLRAGDIILKVNHKSVKGLALHSVVKKIRGPKGTSVTLTIRRAGEPEDIEITIIRDYIGIKNVYARILETHKDIGYIKLTSFVPSSLKNIKKMIQELEEKTEGKRLRGLIFDVRGNSGGLFSQSVEIADLFLKDGIIVSVKNQSTRDETYRATAEWLDVPLVVLINSNSASASEIFASAIQENKRGLIVGEKSFGKASVQSLFTPILRNDYYIKLTVARYYSPSGRTIQVSGVEPDFPVPPEFGEKMPVSFREEDLSHHLPKIQLSYESPNKEIVGEIEKCFSKMGISEKILKTNPNPQIKFDYQMAKSADILECYILKTKKKKHNPLQNENL